MARPCKAIGTQSRHNTKAEIQAREEMENSLKGNVDNIKPPSELTKAQKKIFKAIVKELEVSNILCNLDVYILTICARAIDRVNTIELMIDNKPELLADSKLMSTKDKYQKDFLRCCSELSLSPQSRAKLGNLKIQSKQNSNDPVLQALGGVDEEEYEEEFEN